MNKVWKARWIIDKKFEGLKPINLFHKEHEKLVLPEHKADLKNYHMLVRKKFSPEKEIKNAFIDISADDYYKLYINGRFIGQGPAPAYHFNYFYNHYDVSEYLKAGENVISVHVYYQGLINRVWNSGDYRQGMIAELFINNNLYVYTDSSWKYEKASEFTGNIVFGYDTQFVEDIDERLKLRDWREISFNDENWNNAVESPGDDHRLILQPTPILDIYEVSPQTVEKTDEDNYMIDFGHELTGHFKICAKGSPGDIIFVMYGEEMVEGINRHVRHQMRCNCNYKDKWILSGGEDVLETYDYKTFRYVEISGATNAIQPESFSAIVRHYPISEEKCKFYSSDKLLNDIWSICKNAVIYGSQEVYVDCPSREKGQYLGDVTVTAHAHLYLSGDLRLFKKALKDFSLSALICPGIMAVAPCSHMQEIADYSLQWTLQLLNYYMQSGDREFLAEMYPVAEGILGYFDKFRRKDGLLENVREKWNLVDWPENMRDWYDFDLSPIVGDGCHNVINAFYYGAMKSVNEIRGMLGIEYANELSRLKESFIKAFYHEDKKLFCDSVISNHTALHSNIIPLFFGLVPDEAVKSVVNFIKTKRFQCGVYNAYFLLKGLSAIGEYDLIYELITSIDEHSWANMLGEGATTCFEAWGKEQKWNTSFCHPWASSPIPVIIEDIIGLKPGKPGWEEVEFYPHIPGNLKEIFLEINTVKGKIRVEHKNGSTNIWKYNCLF